MTIQSFQELLITNYGLLPSGYTGSRGDIGYTGSTGTSAGVPKITAVQVTNSSGTVLDDTAVDVAGGHILITGTGFESGCTVMVNNAPASSTTFVSGTQVRAQLPATAAGTYVIYLVNTDGGVAIRINGITFSTTPTWTTGSTLPAGDTGTPISIQLAAAGATTFSLAAGSTLPGTLTVSSSGLLSGTVPNLVNETTYSFTIVATDTELQDSPRTFTITITAGDPLFAQTTLLLSGSATTFVRDASTNNFAVTVVGDARPNTFNPYLIGWSNFFDGTGDSLTVPSNAAFSFGTGDFTIEFWVYYPPVSNTNGKMAVDSRPASTNGSFWNFGVSNTGIMGFTTMTSGGITISDSTARPNQWVHYAATRSGTSLRLFANGTQVASATNSDNISSSGLFIGTNAFSSVAPDTFWLGHISNLRIIKGTAVYTGAFTPPTQPLAPITNTSLLTCADNRFRDASTNNVAITRTGDVTVDSFAPFVEPVTTNGSGFFDGTGDYLDVPSNAAFTFGTGDFTIEFWAYLTAISASTPNLIDLRGGVTVSPRPTIFMDNGVLRYYTNGNARIAGPTLVANVWYHIALCRNSGTTRLFVNGAQVGSSFADTTNYTSTTVRVFASNDANAIVAQAGYCSNLRILNGTALYTAAFTPPTQPLTAVANTSLLTLQNNRPTNNSMFLDSSSENFVITRNGNATQGTFSPYSPAGWSNYFDGTGDALSLPTTEDRFNFGTGDFCVEAFVNLSSTAEQYVVGTYDGGNGGWALYLSPTGSTISFRNGDASVVSRTFSFVVGTWYHIAVSRSSSTLRFFVNGTQVGADQTSYTQNISRNNTNGCAIGRYMTSINQDGSYVTGYISNVRVVKGTAVYTANFTTPTQPLTAIAGTSLLTCMDNRFIDYSPNNLAITRVGDVRATNFSPFRAQTQVPNTYSAFFDGTGDYLQTASSSAFTFGTGDLTLECWIYQTATSAATYRVIFGDNVYGSLGGYTLYSYNNALNLWKGSNPAGGIEVIAPAGTISLNTWTHVAWTRSGSSNRLFINGTQVGATTTDATNYTSTISSIGASQSGTFPFAGYISNVRIIKGTAVYTANFTPSTTPLTAITNTSLLTCQSPTFVDNSTNRFAISVFGNSQPTMVNPFGFTFTNTAGYSAVDHGGSMYFDGTGDSLNISSNQLIHLSDQPFTIEAWVYPNANNGIIVGRRAAVSARGFFLGFGGSAELTNKFYFWAGDTDVNFWNVQLTSASTFNVNQWCHVAVTRNSSNVFTLWVNGVSQASATASFAIADDTSNLQIGIIDTAGSPFNGYISNLRIAKGTLLYTSNFVPPIAPVQPVQNTVLLLNGTSAAITDATTKTVLETVGDARITTAVNKWGGSSMFFDGTGDYLLAAPSNNLEFGSGDFTIEFWLYRVGTGRMALYHGSFGTDWSIGIDISSASPNTSNTIGIWASSNGTSWNLINADLGGNGIGTIPVAQNTWTHIAYVRSGTTWRLFVNGVVDRNLTGISGSIVNRATSPKAIGAWFSTGSLATLNGYLQDFRITAGTARYTANFTPPTAAFQTR